MPSAIAAKNFTERHSNSIVVNMAMTSVTPRLPS